MASCGGGGDDPGDFQEWLSGRMREMSVDDEVYTPYVVSMLQEEDGAGNGGAGQGPAADGAGAGSSECSIKDLLEGLGVLEMDSLKFSAEIRDRWKRHLQSSLPGAPGAVTTAAGSSAAAAGSGAEKAVNSMQAQLASITESKTTAYAKARAAKVESAGSDAQAKDREAVKAAILAKVRNMEDDDDLTDMMADDGGGGGSGGGEDGRNGASATDVSSALLLMRNTNAESVAKAEQERREKSRAAAQAKKDKDKEDREKQKKDSEDRKKKAQEKASRVERKR